MTLANDYFMQKWPDVGKTIITNKERPSHIWTRAVYYEGLMALYSIDPKEEYYTYAVDWGNFHEWGFRSGNKTRNADDYCCGQTYIDLYLIDPKPERLANIKTCADFHVNDSSNGDWDWIDAIQMGMPVFAKLGVLLNDTDYFDKMHKMYMFSRDSVGENGLYNEAEGLWWRDADFDPPYTEPNGDDCYWSRGNGWVYVALARVMDITKSSTPYNEQYLSDYKEMSAALIKEQRTDGLWNVSLQDPTNYGGKELTGTAMFVYGMAWGVNNGYLDTTIYQPVIDKAWNAIISDGLHPSGFLGYVQGTGKEPKDGQPVTYNSMPDFEDYGLGAFLLAGKEMYKLKKK
ncbi:MAG: glycoside hydrolase family 88 protein [Bacteroidales bacterium]|nr:glycoside hydrolase family 88 protein [Bacteroidales bacterium]